MESCNVEGVVGRISFCSNGNIRFIGVGARDRIKRDCVGMTRWRKPIIQAMEKLRKRKKRLTEKESYLSCSPALDLKEREIGERELGLFHAGRRGRREVSRCFRKKEAQEFFYRGKRRLFFFFF